MLRRVLSSVLAVSLTLPGLPLVAAPTPLVGFTAEASEKQRALEAEFDRRLDRANLRAWMKQLSAKPHHVGSPGDKEVVDFIAEKFRSWGYQTRVERFDVLFATPKTRVLELVGPTKYTAKLAEPPLAEDSTSAVSGQLPIYNAYSIDGDVTGELVYVNYGVPDDYDRLAERGIDVKGKIVLARYGGSWRGIKPKVAAERGAIGCIIYSDPRDDGYGQGEVYPQGPWRNPQGAQRGSVADMPVHPGDPLTPGVGSTPGAKRLAREQAATLTKIPVLPISYEDALPLLRAMGGPVAPPEWRGALPVPYRLGAGPARVHLKLAFEWQQTPVYDVIAELKGSERPDEWVIRGNHHDAWVFGANDPISGAVALMEEARAVAALTQTGWRPKRTLVYALWGGEEPGLLGSTEWVETHADELRQKAVLYVNSDSNARGFLNVGGSHSLEKFVSQVAAEVTDPETKMSVAERARAYDIVRGNAEQRRAARERPDRLPLEALGSGSDYTPFLQHLGIASLNLGYGGEGVGGSYHSIYDSYDNYVRFLDPSFDYGIALAQTAGRLVLRAAEAPVIPVDFTGLSETVGGYLKEIRQLHTTQRERTAERNRQLAEKSLVAVADPTQTFVPPPALDPVPELDLTPLDRAIERLDRAAARYRALLAATPSLSGERRRTLDAALMAVERTLTLEAGLPERPWFRHQIYAPGFYTGYGVKTLPGVREAIEQRQWERARTQTAALARTIERSAEQIEKAVALAQ